MAQTKIIVLDDDPTGSQTVHSCLLLTRWDVDTLKEGLQDSAPLFFVLTNTRGMSADAAAKITREVCHNLQKARDDLAIAGQPIQPVMVSRSDSTLRGHYPVETDVIAESMGPFDAHFLVPAFFEGGRITRNGIHYLLQSIFFCQGFQAYFHLLPLRFFFSALARARCRNLRRMGSLSTPSSSADE